MTSPILLGGTQMCEHGLGSDAYNTWGGWSGSGLGGRVALADLYVTVKNPSQALIVGFADLTCYTGTPGTVIQGSVTVNGGGQSVWGELFFNRAGDHTQYSFGWYMGWYSPAQYHINVGLWVAAGEIEFDYNDGGTFGAWERI